MPTDPILCRCCGKNPITTERADPTCEHCGRPICEDCVSEADEDTGRVGCRDCWAVFIRWLRRGLQGQGLIGEG